MQWIQLHERKVAGLLIFSAMSIVLVLALSGTPDFAVEVERGNASIPDEISLTDLIEPVLCTVTELTDNGSTLTVVAEASGGNGTFSWHALGGTPATGSGPGFATDIDITVPGYGLLLISGDESSSTVPTRTDTCVLTP